MPTSVFWRLCLIVVLAVGTSLPVTPAQAASGDRLGIRTSNGQCATKPGLLQATPDVQQARDCVDLTLAPGRIGVVTSTGKCITKDTYYTTPRYPGETSQPVEGEAWYRSGDCLGMALTTTRTAIRDRYGDCLVWEKSQARQTRQSGPNCTGITLSGDRIGVRTSDGNCWVKEGGLDAAFVRESGPGCTGLTLDGNRIGVRTEGGSCWVKEGSLHADFVRQDDCTGISLSGNVIATSNASGYCAAKQGPLNAIPYVVAGPGCADITVSGDWVAVRMRDGQCWAREGVLVGVRESAWIRQPGDECRQITLAGASTFVG